MFLMSARTERSVACDWTSTRGECQSEEREEGREGKETRTHERVFLLDLQPHQVARFLVRLGKPLEELLVERSVVGNERDRGEDLRSILWG